jgi:hypothetical protein
VLAPSILLVAAAAARLLDWLRPGKPPPALNANPG